MIGGDLPPIVQKPPSVLVRGTRIERPTDPPSEREVALARGLLAILRTHEEGGEPETWTISPQGWGDGRTTFEVRNRFPEGTTGLVCQFRPDDVDGTEQDANACVSAAKSGVALAREILAWRGGR